MNLKFKNNIHELNLLNRIYNSIPDKIEFNLKEILGIERVIYFRPAGKYLSHEEEGVEFAFRLLPDGEFVFLRLPILFLSDFFESISEKKGFALTPITIAFVEYILLKFVSLNSDREIFRNLKFHGLIDDRFKVRAENYLNLVLAADFSGNTYFVSAGLSKEAARRIIDLIKKEKEETLHNLEICIIPVIAEGNLTLEELKSINYGDFVVFKNSFIKIQEDGKKGGRIMIKTEDGEIAGEYNLEKEEFRVSGENPLQENSGSEKHCKNLEQVINNIPITLCVELERIKMKIGEIKCIVPGYLMELQKKEIEEVNLSANGKIFARGKLLFQEDTLSVEITSIVD